MINLAVLLFLGFLIGTLVEILVLLEGRRTAQNLEHFRLIFFFVACLLLVCLVPLRLAGLLSRAVLATNLAAVGANAVGWILTCRWQGGRPEEKVGGKRAYQLYYQGEPYGLITRETFAQLARHELLKKQRTVELVDDYQERARQQGIEVQRLANKEGTQILIKVAVRETQRSD